MDQTSSRLSHLSADKRALLEQRLRKARAAEPQAMSRRPDGVQPPLSFAQQRLWFMDQLSAGDSHYNMTRVFTLGGALDERVLTQTWEALQERHESLRTTFRTDEHGEPYQMIAPTQPLPLVRIDLTGVSAHEQRDVAMQQVLAEANAPFDLTVGPLFRLSLLVLGAEEHWLQITMHHIISDGASFGRLTHEFGTLYAALVAGRPSPLAPLAIQYADYACWLQEPQHEQRLQKQLSYWEQKLQGAEPLLEIPTDFTRPTVQTTAGSGFELEFPQPVIQALKDLGAQEGASPFITLLAAFKTLLLRYTGQADIIVGCPVSTRSRETEAVIGFFVNSVVMRTELAGEASFRDNLRRVRETALEAYSNQDVAFEKVVERLAPNRDLSHSPLFQIEFQTEFSSDFTIDGLDVQTIPVEAAKARFDLSVSVAEEAHRCSIWFEYNTDLFKRSTIERLARHFGVLLEGIVADPEAPLLDLPVLTAEETQQILVDWNENECEFPADRCLHELVEEQVARTPDNIAAVYGEQHLTYRELNEQANALAHYLRAQGVGPDSPVAVCMERSLELVVALLGTLKAGGAYLPIDPEAPADRVRQLIEDADAEVCLTQSRLEGQLPLDAAHMVWMEAGAAWTTYPTDNLPLNVTPDHLVSLYYTSGSTGKPKGVANLHKGWVNRMTWMQRYHQMTETEAILQKTVLTFDDSAVEFFWPLIVGARIALIPPGLHRDPQAILEAAAQHGVAIIQFVPSVLELFYECIAPDDRERLATLRTLISSGEALKPELVRIHLEKLPHAVLYNQWGPTEVSIDATVHPCGPDDLNRGDILSIGRPIDNVPVYILDRKLRPVPVGVIGELYLTGIGLARGYLNNPERTAEAFLPNTMDDKSPLMYKTGDRAFYREDGSIMFVGRLDDQVKIRGVRIELGEIEAVMIEHPQVRSAVVLAYEASTGDKRLMAYVVLDDPAVSVREIESYLKSRLPNYMVPARIAQIETVPLTPNGKVDRKALKLLAVTDDSDETRELEPPQTATEQKLHDIWAAVLKRESLSRTDHFFEVGGHSLLAVQVLNRMRKELQVAIELKEMFVYVTLDAMAAHVDALRAAGQSAQQVPVTRGADAADYPLSHAQKRLWFLHQYEPESTVYQVPALVECAGELQPDLLAVAWQRVVERHEALRTVVFDTEEGPRQQIVAASAVPLERLDLSGQPADAFAAAIQRVEQSLTDLSEKPPVRAVLIQREANRYQLYVNLHHIVTDGWSQDVLFRDLSTAYEALVAGQEPDGEPLPVRYVDYAAWQNQLLEEGGLAAQESYWLTTLAHPLPVLDLPTDAPRPDVMTFNGAVLNATVSVELAEQLRAVARREGVSMYVVLLSAYVLMLHTLSNQDDLIVGTPIAGRTAEELEGLVGFFVNTLPVRMRLADVTTLRELIQDVQRQFLQASAHQDYPFDLLVEKVNPVRDASRTPLFSTAFLYVARGAAAEDAKTLRFTSVDGELEQTTAKLDLNLAVVDEAGGAVQLAYVYNTDLFRAETLERFAEVCHNALQALVNDLGAPLAEVDVLATEDRALYRALNETGADFPTISIVDAFAAQVARHADRPALSDAATTWSFAELDARSTQYAQLLYAQGVQRGELVGLMMDRHTDAIAAMLGVLKSGAAYVPLDPDYPEDRIRYMLTDSGARLVLTDAMRHSQVTAYGVTALTADDLPTTATTATGTHGTSPLALTHEDLAYVIYTSGSTGRPKGTLLRHGGVVNLALWKRDAHGYSEQDVVLQFASFSFDASVWEIFPALLNGAHVHVLAGEQRQSAAGFAAAVAAVEATDVTLPTAFFNQLSAHLSDEELAGLRSLQRLFLAGEALQPEIVRTWRRRAGDATRIVNAYGPTETTVCATAHVVGALTDDQASIPIGRPLRNFRVYVLNARQQLCPINVPGELCVSGGSLALGYLNQPEKTADVFLPHPFQPGEQLYRTGDIVRLLPDGTLDFIGRRDDQVKIRGHRVEIGEIEELLLKHPDVDLAAVTVKRDHSGSHTLTAFFTVTADRLDEQELSRYAATHLPAYMVPSRFVRLAELPVGMSGKIDRLALNNIELSTLTASLPFVAPTTATEVALATLWADVLKCGPVSRTAQFFELGGHSLLAIQLVNRVQKDLHVKLTMKDVFQHLVLAEMAALIDSKQGSAPAAALTIPRLPDSDAYEFSQAQKRLWFFYKLDPTNRGYDVSTMGVHRGPLDADAFAQAMQWVIERHDVLRTRVVETDGVARQVLLPDPQLDYEWIDLSGLARTYQEQFIALKVQEFDKAPFDLKNGTLLRALLFKRKHDEHQLFLNVPHLLTDGWSQDVLFHDLALAYEAALTGTEPAWQPLPIRYVDYASWQNELLANGGLAAQEAYWLETLAHPLPVLELPTDAPRPEVMTFNGARLTTAVEAELSEQLRALARREGVSLYVVLLAAYVLMLHTLTDQQDVIVGTPVAGRTSEELEGMVGFFVNTLPLRTRFDELTTLDDLVQAVQRQFLNATDNQDYPFDLLVEKVNPARDTSRSPIFSVAFLYHAARAAEQAAQGLHFAPVAAATEETTAKFDLNLMAVDEATGRVQLSYEYNTDLFHADTLQRFDAIYQQALHALAGDTQTALHQLDLLPAADRALYDQLNDTGSNFPTHSIVEAFAEQVARHANRPALSDAHTVLTYAELDARSNQYAHLLLEQQVQTGEIVALMMHRNVEAMAAKLGIQKAGGAYVPIDPDYPEERIRYMLTDSGARLVVTEEELQERVRAYGVTPLTPQDVRADLATATPQLGLTGDDLAYVIYTSGSTGRPKGTLLRHAGVLNLAAWKREGHGYGEDDVILQFASFSFDASVMDIYPALLNGARVHVLSGEQRQSASGFAAAVAAVHATGALLPTAFFNQLSTQLTADELTQLSSLKRLFLGGEALQPEIVRAWRRRAGTQIEIVNAYGPTEITVCATAHVVGELTASQGSIPIGKPHRNFEVLVMNSHGQLCPVNVPGELYIAGGSLAVGYLNQPEKTAEAFVPHPFRPGQRAYRTGDIVRLLPDGTLDYVGRRDAQVKIRGHRVEIGEIEDLLLKHAAVDLAAVIVRKDASGSQSLFAYYTEAGGGIAEQELRSYAAAHMPAYMVPSQFICLPEMPLLMSGKIDRNALATAKPKAKAQQNGATKPHQGTAIGRNGFTQSTGTTHHPALAEASANSQTEHSLRTLWAELLHREADSIGLDENFFDLGGHSLLLATLQERIATHYEQQLPLTDLFKYTTIRTLAGRLTGQAPSSQRAEIRALPNQSDTREAVAIIGIGLRFPQAKTTYDFWHHLRTGRELIQDLAPEDLPFDLDELDPEVREHLVLRGVELEDLDQFDHKFFHMTHKEASALDPQQRLFMMCAWEAIENGGYRLSDIQSSTSLYAGISQNGYNPQATGANASASDQFQAEVSTMNKLVATRTSYKLNLRGESILVDTACSTSLVAVHMACQSLLTGQSDYALAGGACVSVAGKSGVCLRTGLHPLARWQMPPVRCGRQRHHRRQRRRRGPAEAPV